MNHNYTIMRKLILLSLVSLFLISCEKDDTKPSEAKIESVNTITVTGPSGNYFQDEVVISSIETPTITSTVSGPLANTAFTYKSDTYIHVYRAFRTVKTPYVVTVISGGKTLTANVN